MVFFQIVHPKYNFFTYENDIALVKVENRVRFADNIIPICLPGNDDLLIGKILLTGFDSLTTLSTFAFTRQR
jgi:hypothetical protein